MKEIKPWVTLRSEMAFDQKWYPIRRDEVQLPGGHRMDDYFVSLLPEVVLVFAVTTENEVLLVRQYKHGLGDVIVELPGGFYDPAEEEDTVAALRELREETGFAAEKITRLPTLYDNPTKDTHGLHLFVAEGAHLVANQELDVSEEIEIFKIPLEQIRDQVVEGKILGTGSVALIFLALAFLEKSARQPS